MGIFAKVLAITSVYEGGNVDDPHDPGGRTSRGVTQHNYDDYCDKHNLSRADVWKASDNTIAAFYRECVWNRIGGDDLPDGIDLVIFDAAVNSGVAQAAKWVQRSLGLRRVDGDFGPATKAAIRNYVDDVGLVKGICARRLAMLHALPTWRRYGVDWEKRVNGIQRTALKWIKIPSTAEEAPEIIEAVPAVIPTPKAKVETIAKPMDHSGPNTITMIGGVMAAGAATVKDRVTDVANQLQPLQDILPHITQICAGLTVIGVACGLWISFRHARYKAVTDGSATTTVKE